MKDKKADNLPYWNYRVIRHTCTKTGEKYLAIHSVYYNEKHEVRAWCAEPELPASSDDLNELRNILQMMLNACDNANLKRRPDRRILDESEMPTGEPKAADNPVGHKPR